MATEESLALIRQIESKQSIRELIKQIKKDAILSGIDFDLEEGLSSEKLILYIYDLLYNLLINDFGSYLNFLYRVDISEHTLKSIDETDPKKIAEIVTLLLLQREWKKIYFRNRNL